MQPEGAVKVDVVKRKVIAFWGRGGNGFGWGNNCGNGFAPFGDGIGFGASSYGFQNYRATCDAEKSEIINTART